ncbi:MAG: hypothetical protein LQ352_007466, partial [Teloschistes flavicans]
MYELILSMKSNFAIHFSVDIIYEAETLVQQVFFLVTVIIYQSAYISEIALLGVLYLLLPHCSGHPDRESKPRLWKSLQTGHTIFLAILSSIWAAALALKIKYQVDFVTSYYVYDYDSTVKPFVRLDTSYSILYFFATLEVVTWAVVGFVNREKRSEHGQVLTILLAAICFPLFIRSVYLMADVIYEELQQHTGSRQLSLATNIIYILTSLPIYAAIVAICRALVKKHAAVPPYHQDPDHMHYNPNHWANGGNNNGAMTHDPSKPHMAAHEALPPPMYSQQPQPMMQQQQQQGQGHYPPQLQMHPQMAAVYQQPMQQQQQHHHPNQNQTQQPLYNQQQHHPYQNPAYSPYHHQQQQQQATMIPQQQQQRVQSPPLQYEMGGGEV